MRENEPTIVLSIQTPAGRVETYLMRYLLQWSRCTTPDVEGDHAMNCVACGSAGSHWTTHLHTMVSNCGRPRWGPTRVLRILLLQSFFWPGTPPWQCLGHWFQTAWDKQEVLCLILLVSLPVPSKGCRLACRCEVRNVLDTLLVASFDEAERVRTHSNLHLPPQRFTNFAKIFRPVLCQSFCIVCTQCGWIKSICGRSLWNKLRVIRAFLTLPAFLHQRRLEHLHNVE